MSNLFYSQNWLNLHELNFGYKKQLEQKTLHPISLSIMLCLSVWNSREQSYNVVVLKSGAFRDFQ
jgi:hypothetical protein